ncbi:hypothetical protein D3C71_1500820 [compost metagenome]
MQVDQVAVVFTQLLHGLDMPQAEFRVDVDVATHGQRAAGDAVFQQGAGPLRNRCGDFTQDAPFVGDVVLEGRAGAVGAPGLAPEGFVQVHVAFHQGGGEQLVLAVDVGGRQGFVRSGAALAEAAVFDQQVFGGGAVGAHVAQPAGLIHCKPQIQWCLGGPHREQARSHSRSLTLTKSLWERACSRWARLGLKAISP